MKKSIQRQKKEKIVSTVLEHSQACLFKKTVVKAVHKSFLKNLKPFVIVNAKNFPNEIVNALEEKYILIDKAYEMED